MIFRIYDDKNAPNTNTDGWAPMNTIITSEQIKSIQSADGDTPDREITSIPSPWGRLDLVRTAFRNVNNSKSLHGNTLDYKLVSDVLDIAQICFHLKRFVQQEVIEILRWDRTQELQRLSTSAHQGHQELERAWSKYLAQDEKSFNFSTLNEIAIFHFVHPITKERTVIGASSPVTLFFPAAGNLSHIAEHIAFGQDRPFDGEYTPLTNREEAFVIWLYALRESYANFSTAFKDFNEYLDLCKPQLKASLQAKINQLNNESYNNDYSSMDYQAGQPMYILNNLPIRVDFGNNAHDILNHSDFVIQTRLNYQATLPLVLPTSQGWGHLFYISDKWDSDTHVAEQDTRPLEQRILPGDGSVYPYLTIGDFLEDRIIKLKNSINTTHFYAGELESCLAERGSNYLLPLKPLFFEFFSVDDLINKKMLRLDATGDRVVVELNIPVKGGIISYRRYYTQRIENFEIVNDDIHTIEDFPLELGLIHTHVYSPLCYVLPQDHGNNASLQYLSPQGWQPEQNRTEQALGLGDMGYCSAIQGRFDALRLQVSETSAIIIPQPKSAKVSNDSIEYAVDLGTSNTCIAYRLNGIGNSQILNWSKGEMTSMLTKFDVISGAKGIIEGHLSLSSLGEGLHVLPLRTALLKDKDRRVYEGAMLGMCPSLNYQYQDIDIRGSETITDIKWANEANNYRLKAYINSLCVWLRRHADNLGIKDNIKLTWLFPSSMTPHQQEGLRKVWQEATQEILGCSIAVTEVNEAVAPYQYLTINGGVKGRTVAMDIGGGTVDVLLTGSHVQQEMSLTSFRLGANILYTAPSRFQGAGSGFARMLYDYLAEHTDKHDKIGTTMEKMQGFIKGYQSEEAVDKFFSLAKQLEHEKFKGVSLRLDDILQDENRGRCKLRSAVLLYFTLQVYHIAELMYHQRLARPNSFVFSGNGSRVLYVLGNRGFLSDLITHIFNFVADKYQTTGESGVIEAMFNPEPKESTTYGAIIAAANRVSSPQECKNIGGGLILNQDSTDRAYQQGDEELVYDDLRSFLVLFGNLNSRLRLVRDWGYDNDSLEKIHTILCNKESNKVIFDSYVRLELEQEKQKNESYSQSPFFSFVAHAIKEIVYELYPQQ